MPYPPALFAYDVTPNTVPFTGDSRHVQRVTLMLTVNNPTARPLDCTQLVFSLPVGAGKGSLTTNPSAIDCSPGLDVPWTIGSDGEGSFTALPQPPATGLEVGDSIAFLLTDVEVNELQGGAMITVYEATDTIRTALVPVIKMPPGLAITRLSAGPVQVRPGQPSWLAWETTGAGSCTLSWDGQTVGVDTAGEYAVRPQTTTTYTLTAVGDSTPVTEQVTVYVPQVTILSFAAVPFQIAQGGRSSLSWLVNNADTCHIAPGSFAVDPRSGSQDVDPQESSTYTLTAKGFGRTVSMPAPVEVMPVRVDSFTATPSLVPPGGIVASSLGWSTTWATACAIDPGVGAVPVTGTVSVTPTETTTYRLEAAGRQPQRATATVTVCPAVTFLEIVRLLPGPFVGMKWQVVGGSVTLARDDAPAQPVPASGAMGSGPASPVRKATLTVTGVGVREVITVTFPGPATRTAVSPLNVSCAHGLNAAGATASVSWKTRNGTVDGSVVAATTQVIAGDSGSLTVPLGSGGGGRLWSLDLGIGAGPDDRIRIDVGLPEVGTAPRQTDPPEGTPEP